MVIGADSANSRVAKSIKARNYAFAIACQERIKLPEEKMAYYENLDKMYVGHDVSPDFYGWVFPKCDHVAVGTDTVCSKPDIKIYLNGLRKRPKINEGKVIKVEAHPISEHPRLVRVQGQVALVGDTAGYVTKCSDEGIYFATKSGWMCGEAMVRASKEGLRMINEGLRREYLKKWDEMYFSTFKVLDILQRVFYGSDAAKEALVELCGKCNICHLIRLAEGNRWEDLKLLFSTIGVWFGVILWEEKLRVWARNY
ncbi:LOW QUALITY PROTEIN: hypothetical protein RJ641_008161 [Dillenia turbinata]|uniref:Geranylgeranyl diphosphate reductase n=1 Tax=Dillenia turbinata TaxID=194707 RepID=A0AAN8VFB2_9MAGN